MSNHINEESGVDLVALATSLPNFLKPADFVATTFNLDTTAIRNELYSKSNDLYKNGNELEAYLYHFLGAYLIVIELCEVYSKPVAERPEVYELFLKLYFKDGTTEDFSPVYLSIQKQVNSQTEIIPGCLFQGSISLSTK